MKRADFRAFLSHISPEYHENNMVFGFFRVKIEPVTDFIFFHINQSLCLSCPTLIAACEVCIAWRSDRHHNNHPLIMVLINHIASRYWADLLFRDSKEHYYAPVYDDFSVYFFDCFAEPVNCKSLLSTYSIIVS